MTEFDFDKIYSALKIDTSPFYYLGKRVDAVSIQHSAGTVLFQYADRYLYVHKGDLTYNK